MRMPRTAYREVDDLLQRCLPLALTCVALTVAVLVREGSVLLAGAVAVLFAGAVCGALLILSWRYYHPWFSWLLWAVPGALLTSVVFEFTLGPPLVSGAVSVVSAFFVLVGCGGLGFFGLLFILRGSVKRWFGMQ
jgi:hypothetical protein